MTTAAAEIEDGLGTLAGTGKLLRFQARRSRLFLFWWIAGIAGFTWMTIPVLVDQYQTAAERAGFAATMSSPAMLSMSGPIEYVNAYADSIGALFTHRMLLWTGAMTAVMFVLLVTRLTRADEETSRSEVIRSLPIGRRADLAAALQLSVIAAVAPRRAPGARRRRTRRRRRDQRTALRGRAHRDRHRLREPHRDRRAAQRERVDGDRVRPGRARRCRCSSPAPGTPRTPGPPGSRPSAGRS